MIRCAVLGSPISHSLSPTLHRSAYEHLGVEGQYEALEVTSENLSEFISNLEESWTGFSLTMPLKERILNIADDVDPLALRIKSANTLVRVASGWRALSTDVNGFTQSLASAGVTDFVRITILGSGATARAAAASCDAPGRQIIVIHRNPERERSMRDTVLHSQLEFRDWGANLEAGDVLINTTPACVADSYSEKLEGVVRGLYFEALYKPWPSKLLARWRALSGFAIDGLDLLVHQGIDQVELFTGQKVLRADLAPVLRTACLAAMKP
jgi:shikimate dehydrogenase